MRLKKTTSGANELLRAKNDDSNIKEGTDFPLAVEKIMVMIYLLATANKIFENR